MLKKHILNNSRFVLKGIHCTEPEQHRAPPAAAGSAVSLLLSRGLPPLHGHTRRQVRRGHSGRPVQRLIAFTDRIKS